MKRKKYGNGTAVTNYIENPYEVLQEDKIDKAQAVYKAKSNPLTQILDVVGQGLMQYGMSQGGSGNSLADTALMTAGQMDFGNGGNVLPGPGDPPGKTDLLDREGITPSAEYAAKYKAETGKDLPTDAYITQIMLDEFIQEGTTKGRFEQYIQDPPAPNLKFKQIPVSSRDGSGGLFYAPDNKDFSKYNKDNPMPIEDWKKTDYYKTNQWQKSKAGEYEYRGFNFGVEPNLGEDPNKFLYQGQNAMGTGRTNQWLINQSLPPITEPIVPETKGNGGMINNVPVNIEGEEVIETPNGDVMEVKGPSHEQGGIDTTLPAGTKVYSNRIKIKGDTMEERKLKRERKKENLQKTMTGNESDVILKSAMNRTTQTNQAQEEQDMKIQQFIDALLGGQPMQKSMGAGGIVYGNGTPPEGIVSPEEWAKIWTKNQPNIPPTMEMYNELMLGGDPNAVDGLPTKSAQTIETPNNNIPSGLPIDNTPKTTTGYAIGGDEEETGLSMPNVTGGDLTSIAGNLVSSFGPYLNTLKNRAGDTPNINAFADFGKEGLDKLDEAKQYTEAMRASKLRDAQLAKQTALKRGRNSSRGVNTSRALDLATEQSFAGNARGINDEFAQQMLAILGQEAQGEFMQDKVVMEGEQNRDLYDRMDSDNFSTQIAQNIVGIGEGLQETGKDINAIKERDVITNLLNELSKYGIQVDNQGNIVQG